MQAIDELDGDEPLAVAGAAPGATATPSAKKKKGGMPAWLPLAIFGFVVVIILALVVASLVKKQRQQRLQDVEVSRAMPELAPAAQPAPAAGSAVPTPAAPSASTATSQPYTPSFGAYSGAVPVVPTPAAPLLQTSTMPAAEPAAGVVAGLDKRVAELEADLQAINAALTNQPSVMRRILAERAQRAGIGTNKPAQRTVMRKARPQAPLLINNDYKVLVVVGDAAWLRSHREQREVTVHAGDVVQGGRVVAVRADSKTVVLDTNQVIR